jgi:hypothetical protein
LIRGAVDLWIFILKKYDIDRKVRSFNLFFGFILSMSDEIDG